MRREVSQYLSFSDRLSVRLTKAIERLKVAKNLAGEPLLVEDLLRIKRKYIKLDHMALDRSHKERIEGVTGSLRERIEEIAESAERVAPNVALAR